MRERNCSSRCAIASANAWAVMAGRFSNVTEWPVIAGNKAS